MAGQSTAGQLLSGLPRELDADTLIIGSGDRHALVVISGAEAIHAVITYWREGFEEPRWWIEDRSALGTFLNGVRLERKTPLSNGDRITIAGVDVNFENGWLREGHGRARGVRVDVQGVSDVRDGRPVLRSVSFCADEGEFVGILGPSGCGKSSIIQRIAGLSDFVEGNIAINGHPIFGDSARGMRQLVAYLPQNVEDSLHGELSIREEMNCARRIYLAPGEGDETGDAAILKTLGLSNEAEVPIGKLSGGQKRRVAIAIALLRQPQLFLLDEPTAGLDPATETEVMRYLRRLSDQGYTVICATHVMENVSLFDKVLVMASGEKKTNNGGCSYFGSPAGVLAYFGVETYPELYARLKEDTCAIQYGDAGTLPMLDSWDLPEPPAKASFIRSVGGYLRRSASECLALIIHPRTLIERVLPGPIRNILLQPVLIAIGLKWGCAKMFSDGATNMGGGVSTVMFCAALSVFWLGLAGNVQGLVRERVPGRCLERLGGVSLCRYLSAKVVTLTGSCFVKTLLFTLLLFLMPEIGSGTDSPSFLVKCLKDNEVCTHPFGVCAGIYGVLVLVCVMGGLVGLAVSAVARKATAALSVVPVIAVLALFFSQPVIQFDMNKSADGGSARWITEWMPCYRAQLYTSVLIGQGVCDDKDKPEAASRFFLLFLMYAFGAVGLSLLGQGLNERAWNGR